MLVSIAAHALAAVTASVVLPIALRGEAHEVEIEVDLARADLTGPAAEPQAAPPPAPASQPPSTSRKPNHVRTLAANVPRPSNDLSSAREPAEAPQPSSLADEALPLRFTLPSGIVATQAPSPGTVTGDFHATTGSGGGTSGAGEVLSEKDVSVAARLISSGPVAYPPEARKAEIEADVQVQILVDSDGHVVEARNLSHDGFGFDEAATRAIRTWRFSPALRDGHPVRVRMRWIVQFRLR